MKQWFYRYVRMPAEGLLAELAYAFFRILPLDLASAVGGWAARLIGPHLGVSARARRNIHRALPKFTDQRIDSIVRGMWDNFGRVIGEFPHLAKLRPGSGRIDVIGVEHVLAMRDDGQPGIFFSGHIANWELMAQVAAQNGLPLDRVYRSANNRWVDRLYRRGRGDDGGLLIPKGAPGARQLLNSFTKGGHLGMLVDQKMNDGIAVPFFGRDAMTAPALAELALRKSCPLVPAHVERLKGAHFRVIVEPPLELPNSGDAAADVRAVMVMVNQRLEAWIRARPEQWLWMHNRWPD
ncbi:MAG: lauroyl acyltransferase [Proteobacteria bacterium]|nr:lauroyl acyltransferase [Pseudomonadota bacterium]